jgi:hypothetical protein
VPASEGAPDPDSVAAASDSLSEKHAIANRAGPSLPVVIGIFLVACASCMAVVALLDDPGVRLAAFGDNVSYVALTEAIRLWELRDLVPYHFWGHPYIAALISLVTPAGDLEAHVALSLISGAVAVALVHTLWGGYVAGAFAVVSWDLIQRATLGGAEPLFCALVYGAFVGARRERWLLSSLLASYATIVRPLGVFVLLGIGLACLRGRAWSSLAGATLIAMTVGGLYMLPLQIYYGDPLANFHWYQSHDWAGHSPWTLPGLSLVRGLLSSTTPVSNALKVGAWVVAVLVGATLAVRDPATRARIARWPVEVVFAGLYLLFLLSYNSPEWAWHEFPRFATPLVPFVLVAVERILPRDGRVYWVAALGSGALAGLSAINARAAIRALSTMFRRL